MARNRAQKQDRTVSVTVSFPISLASAIQDEADLMGRGFSDATATLVRTALDVRRTARSEEKT